MKKMPCIRNLEAFKKKGCPEKSWNGEEGCSCWIEMPVAERGNPLKTEIRKQCLDKWLFDFQWASLGLAEANVKGAEQLRNGLLMEDASGHLVPKPDMVMCSVLKAAFNPNRKAIQNDAKIITDNSSIVLEENEDA